MNRDKVLKVFLIEDAMRIRQRLIEIFQSSGNIEVVGVAENQSDALTQLRSIEWDVAIVDIGLREGNGLAVLDALRKDERRYGVRLVFSNYADDSLKARSLSLGATAFFDKSLELNELIGQVQELAN